MVTVIIPARDEVYLQKTIESILSAAEGEIEIIAILDGYWPEPIIPDNPRVTLVHHTQPIGQRPAINEAAHLAKGKYILKTDAHSMFDKGFDIKLAADCEYDWTVIPRMYNLHAFNWHCANGCILYQDRLRPDTTEGVCPKCGKQTTFKSKWVWKPRIHHRTDYMYIDKNLKVQYWQDYEKRPENKGSICDVMTGQGACWFMHKDRFWELGGMDEAHGHWGQVGVEIACKAWLSGGRHVVNKKTWFSHLFRTTKVFTFPYELSGKQQGRAKKYSQDFWTNNKWPLQKRKLSWLIEKFAPVPTWNGTTTKDDTIKNFQKLFYRHILRKKLFPLWMGHHVIKYPNDLLLYAEIIFNNKPDILIECGAGRGGSALFFAHLFDIIGKGQVISIDYVDKPRPEHPRITRILGRSTASDTLTAAKSVVKDKTVMVSLDSDHRRRHVKRELVHYGKLVTKGQYMVVEDTNLTSRGPLEAVKWYLEKTKKFKQEPLGDRYLLSICADGWLKRQ